MLGWLLFPLLAAAAPGSWFFALLVALFAGGVLAAEVTGRALGESDHGAIVWDEMVAIWLVLAFTPPTLAWQAVAVALFRLFDISKPPPIRWADRALKGGFGVMVDDPTSVEDLWRDDLVAFLIGCSFSFESELIEAGIEMRHNTQGRNVSMYITNIACEPAGKMSGNMVVSMRPIPYEQVVQAVQISGAIPKVHGAPIHIGDPSVIGIDDISKPDFGDAVDIHEGEVPVFWPCGVTPQSVVTNVKPKFAITHAPGCMLITDTKNISLKF